MSKAVVTCALTGVLTNPKQHPVPVSLNNVNVVIQIRFMTCKITVSCIQRSYPVNIA